MDQGYALCVFDPASHKAIARRKKRHPIGEHHLVIVPLVDFSPHLQPVEGIHRVDDPLDIQRLGSRICGILRLAREEEIGILERKSPDLHLIAFLLKLAGYTLVERRDAAAIGIGCTNYKNLTHKHLRTFICMETKEKTVSKTRQSY